MFIFIYNSYQQCMKWMMNQLLNQVDNLDGINLDKITDLKMKKEIDDFNQMKKMETNKAKFSIQTEDNHMEDSNSKVIYIILGTTVIIVVMSLGYIYIEDITKIGTALGTSISEYGHSIHQWLNNYFFGGMGGIDPSNITPKAPEVPLPDANLNSDTNIHIDEPDFYGYFEPTTT